MQRTEVHKHLPPWIDPLSMLGAFRAWYPYGITFHNSAQRAVWILGLRNRVDVDEAEVFRQIRKHEYDDCTRAGKDNCGFGRF